MKEINTSIKIDAPAATVWQVLTDLQAYPEWNPFITDIQGTLKEGGKLMVQIAPPGGKSMQFKPTILRATPSKEFRWIGRVLLPGIFDGEHIFEIEKINEQSCQFNHSEKFSGLLVPLMWSSISTVTQKGFELMNEHIKKRAEAIAVGQL